MPLINELPLTTLQVVVESAATIAFAFSGILAAARKRLDAVGVCVVTGLAAFGGGTLRDILLDRRPFFWIEHAFWLWILLGLSLASMLFLREKHFRITEKAMLWPDALGLGLFTAAGTQIALDSEWPALAAVLMGMVTATFGGVLRDIVCNEIPVTFRDHRPYAACAFFGGWAVIAAHRLEAEQWLVLGAGVLVTLFLRALALFFDLRLPGWRADDPGPGPESK